MGKLKINAIIIATNLQEKVLKARFDGGGGGGEGNPETSLHTMYIDLSRFFQRKALLKQVTFITTLL